MKIGLTGSIACGKSTVSDYLRQQGYFVADADEISRSLTAPGGKALPAVRAAFGDSVFDGDILNRRALGSVVFADESKRAQLGALLHPLIIRETAAQLDAHDGPDALIFGDVPLLYECGMESMFDRIWVVSVPRSAQIARLFERDGLNETEAAQRIDAQMPLEEKERRADEIIRTDGPIPETRRQVDALIASARQRRQA